MFQIYGIPDFDQKRTTLPNDGKMYCVPTSFINLVHFMGTHGIPGLLDNVADSNNSMLFSADAAQRYQGITWRIFDMGERCATDPVSGTDAWDPFGATGYDGLRLYIHGRTSAPINIYQYTSDESFPNPADALGWLQNGSVVAFCYGKYSDEYNRDGGHCLTLTGVDRRWVEPPPPEPGSDDDDIEPYNPHIEWNEEYQQPDDPQPSGHWAYTFRYRNAVSGDSLTTQSPFKAVDRGLIREWHTWGVLGGFGGDYYPLFRIGDGRNFVDEYYVVHPQMGLTNVITDGKTNLFFMFSNLFKPVTSSEIKKLGIRNDPNSDWKANEPFYAYTGPSAKPVLDVQRLREQFGGSDPRSPIYTNDISDVVWMPVSQHAVFTIAGCEEVFGYNSTTGVTKQIIKLPVPPRKVIFGGHKRDMFVLMPGKIGRVNMRDIYDSRATVKASAEAPVDAETLAFDEINQRLIVAAKSALHFYDRDLKFLGTTGVKSLSGETRLTVRVSRQTGELYFMRERQRAVQKLRIAPDTFAIRSLETVNLLDSRAPLTFDLGTQDQIVVSDGGRMVEFDPKGSLVRNSYWSQFAAGSCLELTQNFHNPPPYKETTLDPSETEEIEVPVIA